MGFPYALNPVDAAKVFAKENVTIVADVKTSSSISGRGAIICAADPTKPVCTDGTKTNSPYFAYGHNNSNPSYLASSKDTDRFSNNNYSFTGNTAYRIAISMNKGSNSLKVYVNGAEKHSITFPTSSYEMQTFNQFAQNEDAKIYIGGGMTSAGSKDIFDGVIYSVKFYEGALTAAEVTDLGTEPETTSSVTEFYMAADTKQSSGAYIHRYLYNNNGALSTSTELELNTDKYIWTVSKNQDGTYTFANKAGKSLGNDGSYDISLQETAAPYEFLSSEAVHTGSFGLKNATTGYTGSKYMVTKADGTDYNHNSKKVNDGSWSSDYVLIPVDKELHTLTINGNVDATATYNGKTMPLPATFYVKGEVAEGNANVVITSKNKTQTFANFTDASANTVEALRVTSLSENAVYTANFKFGLTDGAKYYIYAYTQPTSGNFVNRYLFKSSTGSVATSPELLEMYDNYIWTAVADGNGFKFENAAGGVLAYNTSNRFFLDANGHTFTLSSESVATVGKVSIISGSNLYVSTKADGSEFNHYTGGQKNGTDWTTDYVFVPAEEPTDVNIVNFTLNGSMLSNATITWNGETKSLPASYRIAKDATIANTTATLAVNNAAYTLKTVCEVGNETNLGASFELSPNGNKTYVATINLDIFSENYGEKWVRFNNCSQNYWATISDASENGIGKTATLDNTDEKQLWCFVGTAENFVLYNKAAGNTLALNVPKDGNYDSGDAAKLTSEKETWKLKELDFGYALIPTQKTNSSELGINKWSDGAGDLKLYTTGKSNTGSYWKFDVVEALTFSVAVTGTQPYANNTRVAHLTTTIEGASQNTIVKGNVDAVTYYLPANATFTLSNSITYRGYIFEGFKNTNGETAEYTNAKLPEGGLNLTATYSVDENNKHQYLFYYRDDVNNKPYRIPAIATASNGTVLAFSDYRPCGNDIGYGEVDIVLRRSYDNGETWSDAVCIADGQGGSENVFNVGFGDAAVVADRESGKVLVMAVAGKQVFASGSETGHNSMAKIVSNDNGENWEAPANVTSQFMIEANSLFPDAYTMFFGSGRLLQSRVYKAEGSDYHRIYGAMLIKHADNTYTGNANFVVYSDDFGSTWKILGGSIEKGMACSGGDEPKVEELPDGSIILSSRKYNGRYFNVFTYTNKETGEGQWGNAVASNGQENGLKFGGNSTNGEIYKVKAIRKSDGACCDVMLQSVPTGSGRSNVSVFYKEMVYGEDFANEYTPTTFSQNWTKGIEVCNFGSAYSTLTLQKDGNFGFFYEEEPDANYAYCMVYVPLSLEELTGGAYALSSAECTTLVEEVNGVLNFIGEGLGKYTVAAENNELLETARTAMENVETVTLSDLNSYKNLLDGATLNMPQPGQYFRVAYDYGGSVGKLYMQGINSGVKSVLFTGETGKSSVWVYSNGTLTSYYDGRNLRETGSHHGLSDTETTVTFSVSPRAKGKYNIQCERYIHAVENGENHYADHCQYDENHATHDLILEEAEVAVENVLIGDWEIGTFYANGAMEIPEGVSAYVATAEPVMEGETGVITLTKIQTGVVPAKTGVIITGKAGYYDFTSVTSDASIGENFMYGYAGPETMKKVTLTDDASYYILTVVNSTPGFYKKAYDFNVYNNKAYLKLPKSQANSIRFRFNNNDGTTDIIEVPTEALNGYGEIYDLSGRRVEKAGKGVYIVNGKKVIF